MGKRRVAMGWDQPGGLRWAAIWLAGGLEEADSAGGWPLPVPAGGNPGCAVPAGCRAGGVGMPRRVSRARAARKLFGQIPCSVMGKASRPSGPGAM